MQEQSPSSISSVNQACYLSPQSISHREIPMRMRWELEKWAVKQEQVIESVVTCEYSLSCLNFLLEASPLYTTSA